MKNCIPEQLLIVNTLVTTTCSSYHLFTYWFGNVLSDFYDHSFKLLRDIKANFVSQLFNLMGTSDAAMKWYEGDEAAGRAKVRLARKAYRVLL